MGLQTFEKTDDLRRLALQLALQLPETVDDARRVLAMTGQCLDEFLIDRSGGLTPLQRARRLGWRAAPDLVPELVSDDCRGCDRSPSVARALCLALATLGVSAPAAVLLAHTVGAGAGFSFGFAVILVAMVCGTVPAMVLALASAIIHNLLVVPPALTLQAPTTTEWVWPLSMCFSRSRSRHSCAAWIDGVAWRRHLSRGLTRAPFLQLDLHLGRQRGIH
jgi:hypothetical protein